MPIVLMSLLGLSLLAVAGVLLAGLITMARGGDAAARRGNRLMGWRIRLQILAVILFVLTMLALRHP